MNNKSARFQQNRPNSCLILVSFVIPSWNMQLHLQWILAHSIFSGTKKSCWNTLCLLISWPNYLCATRYLSRNFDAHWRPCIHPGFMFLHCFIFLYFSFLAMKMHRVMMVVPSVTYSCIHWQPRPHSCALPVRVIPVHHATYASLRSGVMLLSVSKIFVWQWTLC